MMNKRYMYASCFLFLFAICIHAAIDESRINTKQLFDLFIQQNKEIAQQGSAIAELKKHIEHKSIDQAVTSLLTAQRWKDTGSWVMNNKRWVALAAVGGYITYKLVIDGEQTRNLIRGGFNWVGTKLAALEQALRRDGTKTRNQFKKEMYKVQTDLHEIKVKLKIPSEAPEEQEKEDPDKIEVQTEQPFQTDSALVRAARYITSLLPF